jgi:Putative adhesin
LRIPVAILAIAAAAASGCSRAGSDQAFQWSTDLPAGAVVHLRNGSGGIDVRRAEGQVVQVNGSRRWTRGRSSDVQFVVSHTGTDYYVCAMWRNSGNCGANGYRGRNTGGFLSMFSLFHRTTDAAADFVADVPANVVVDARTTNGSVNVAGISAGVTARTSNGDVKAFNVGGPLSLATSNGNVRLMADALSSSDSVNVMTKNGAIQAELPAGLEGNFDLSVVNGNVQTDLPLASTGKRAVGNHMQGQIGSSRRSIRIRALNGSVVVTSRAATAGHD